VSSAHFALSFFHIKIESTHYFLIMSTSATSKDNAESSRAKRGIVECPAQDDRDYGTLVLDNGMQVLLISDATTDKASAALDVRVGHLSDPAEIPGLAHFLEHMLFMGTEK
jgi:secreted Zn-dependent insulinase-like peptidase